MFGSIDFAILSFAPPVQSTGDMQKLLGYLLFIVGAFVVPFVLGTFLSRALRMADKGIAFGLILFSLISSLLIIAFIKPRFGVDIAGGTILKYEIDKSGMADAGDGDKQVKASQLVQSLTQRLNPTGTKEIVIRPIGDDQIEVVVPNVDQMEVEEIKRTIQQAGILKFRIVANSLDHNAVIDLARLQSKATDIGLKLSNEVRNEKGEVVAIWQTVGRDSQITDGVFPLRAGFGPGELARDSRTGDVITLPMLGNGENALEKYLDQQKIETIDLLMTLVGRDGTPFDVVTGDDLSTVRPQTGKSGTPEVAFNMNVAGAQRMLGLTSRNIPKSGNMNRMAIILDGQVLSAPTINNAIAESGVIQGRFTKKEVDFLVSILRSGSLPAALGKQPIGQSQTGALLGASTIERGFTASGIGLITTFLFMLLYYRFSGFIACIALVMNLVILYAFMLLIRQPVTLPGLAGFVLTVGMSVDANVLVYERIREEIARKSTGRMAIRNGYDNAMSTIVDSNLTTLISGIVLYAMGTDQIRGFAVPLILGIIISMFTAVYCSRVFFDIAEKYRFANFSMTDAIAWARRNFLGEKDIDFMGLCNTAFVVSGLAIVIGLAATAMRGAQILDIDFRGGTAVVFSLNKTSDVELLRELVAKSFGEDENKNPIQTNLTNLNVGTYAPGTVYRLETSLQKLDEVKRRLNEGFSGQGFEMVTFRVDIKEGAGEKTSQRTPNLERVGKLVSFELQDPPEATPVQEGEKKDNPPSSEPTAAAPTTTIPAAAPAAAPTTATADGPQPPSDAQPSVSASVNTTRILRFRPSEGNESAKIAGQALIEKVVEAAQESGQKVNASVVQIYPEPFEAGWNRDSMAAFDQWKVILPFEEGTANKIFDSLQTKMKSEPVWLSFDSIGTRVAGQMQVKAIGSLIVSLFFINVYIWFRFHKVAYGLAAVIALLHDVLITLGVLAISHWIYKPLAFLQFEDFKLSLTVVAAFLTIIGYSLNDTIVVFDRIREVKGKSPVLTRDMINKSVNQTLGRTLLTSSTTIIAIAILYFMGGEGIHGFAFCLFVGIIVGTYSSIFVAAPMLLWMTSREKTPNRSLV